MRSDASKERVSKDETIASRGRQLGGRSVPQPIPHRRYYKFCRILRGNERLALARFTSALLLARPKCNL